MVAPTRTPQARGVKCSLCKKILSLATWLDQKKLAKKVEEAKTVLTLIDEHDRTECPCIPKNIENLLIGSTHFELHRLMLKELDFQIHKKQCELHQDLRQQAASDHNKAHVSINDCCDSERGSRFKIYTNCIDAKLTEKAKTQLAHLCSTINYWTYAMEDQANPFNTKLALRLGLTHHIVYACYLFKFYKLFDYQLKTSILLVNVFKSIDGVTANALLHAYYLLIKSFMDCSQYSTARQYLKRATKMTNYQDKAHYESILLNCVDCELRLLDESEVDKMGILDELAQLITIKEDDKLQHYYARTLAMSVIINYIHLFPARSENCFEFFHTYRFVCAIIRRCYKTSFDLVLLEKDLSRHQSSWASGSIVSNQDQILDHTWIRFAVCDFAFSTFDLLVNFYIRAGMPECLELLFNGLSLVALRSGSTYWQSRIVCIGVDFDLLCHKLNDASTKLRALSHIGNFSNDTVIINLLRLECEVGSLKLTAKQNVPLRKSIILDMLARIRTCQDLLDKKISQISIYDCKTSLYNEILIDHAIDQERSLLVMHNPILLRLAMSLLRVGISSLIKTDAKSPDAKYLMKRISDQLRAKERTTLGFYKCQMLLETLLHFINIANSEQELLHSVSSSKSFLRNEDGLTSMKDKFNALSLDHEDRSTSRTKAQRQKINSSRIPRKPWSGLSNRKDIYEVAIKSQENLMIDNKILKHLGDPLGILAEFDSLSREEILVLYLKHSEPNPDYLIYRQVHESLLSLKLHGTADELQAREQILFHFTESSCSNTMRYRWMMYEEQQVSPYDSSVQKDPADTETSGVRTKHLSFSSALTDQEKVLKSLISRLPEDHRVCQMKYIRETSSDLEHMLIICFNGKLEMFCIHTKRSMTSDDFFVDAKNGCNTETLSIPSRHDAIIVDSRKALLSCNKARNETRKKLESELELILHDFENEWLGAYRFILCAKINDLKYNTMISDVLTSINNIMSSKSLVCSSEFAMRMLLEGAALLTREEFCDVVSALYRCPSGSRAPRLCFNEWLKISESYIKRHESNMDRVMLLKKVSKGQIGLILDKTLENLPVESLRAVRIIGQGMFRIPSLRLFSVVAGRRCLPIKIDPRCLAYVLDPANNLSKTRERFESKLKASRHWSGVVGQPPKTNLLEEWLATKQLYLFIGHGAGTTYYNRMCQGKGISAMARLRCAAIIMGCSSGRMVAEGPELESFGIGWAFILRGAPCYMGLLWDVTDNDIDKYTDYLLSRWMPAMWLSSDANSSVDLTLSRGDDLVNQMDHVQTGLHITDVSVSARHVCQLKLLVGSTPVVYGLPILCQSS